MLAKIQYKKRVANLKILIPFLFLFGIISQCNNSSPEQKVEPIFQKNILEKIGEIENIQSSEDIPYFLKITGICCDDKNNLYVADVGWGKIIKFNSKGEFLTSFGRNGQGPGEFHGGRRYSNLKISFGNDKKIYVCDTGNSRISIFNPCGEFIKHFTLPPFCNDSAQVNSYGDIYLLSRSGIKIIDCYDSNFKYKDSFLDFESPKDFPLYKPKLLRQGILHDREYIKLITQNDHIILFSNYSLRVFHFNPDHYLLNKFMIDQKTFLNDLKKLYKIIKLKKRPKDGNIYVLPFLAFLDKEKNICLIYRNILKIYEIYKYKTNGTFMGILRFKENEELDGWNFCSNHLGYIYATLKDRTKIGIYKK